MSKLLSAGTILKKKFFQIRYAHLNLFFLAREVDIKAVGRMHPTRLTEMLGNGLYQGIPLDLAVLLTHSHASTIPISSSVSCTNDRLPY